jgi:hypothetical protein
MAYSIQDSKRLIVRGYITEKRGGETTEMQSIFNRIQIKSTHIDILVQWILSPFLGNRLWCRRRPNFVQRHAPFIYNQGLF